MQSEMLGNIEAVRSGTLSAVEIVRRRLRLLEEENPRVNAVVEWHPEELLEQARQIDSEVARGAAGRLAGAVVTVKDNLGVRGMKATAGMMKLKDNRPEADCALVGAFRREGALILGKTNLPPMAMDAQTDNPVYGRTNHPLFPGRTCGGSSGGGACAVRLGISDMDIGNDFMGSIRIPAHFCGVYGFVPTGTWEREKDIVGGGPMGSALSQMLRMGVQTRDPENIRYVLPILLESGLSRDCGRPAGVFQVAWADDCGLPLAEESRRCLRAFRERLGAENELREITPADFDFEAARECYLALLYGAIAASMPPAVYFLARHMPGQRKLNHGLKDYLAAENTRRACVLQLEALLESFDCLLTPVTATSAFPHRKPDRMQGVQPVHLAFEVDGKAVSYAEANLGYTTPFSLTASPAISMPVGVTQEGLPVGVQVIGRRYGESRLLEVVERLSAYCEPAVEGV